MSVLVPLIICCGVLPHDNTPQHIIRGGGVLPCDNSGTVVIFICHHCELRHLQRRVGAACCPISWANKSGGCRVILVSCQHGKFDMNDKNFAFYQ